MKKREKKIAATTSPRSVVREVRDSSPSSAEAAPSLTTIPPKVVDRRLKLGTGAFGTVVVDPTDATRAMKVSSVFQRDGIVVDNNIREAVFAKMLALERIVKYKAFHVARSTIVTVMPRAACDLHVWCTRTPVDVRMAALPTILRDVASGIAEMHSRGVVHGDIKPQNVLVYYGDSNVFPSFRLSDLGSASMIGHFDHDRCTFLFRPPEGFSVVTPDAYDEKKFDAYSLGAVLYFVMTYDPSSGRRGYLHHPRNVPEEEDKYNPRWTFDRRASEDAHGMGSIVRAVENVVRPAGCPEDVFETMKKLLERDPSKRLSVDDISSDPPREKNTRKKTLQDILFARPQKSSVEDVAAANEIAGLLKEYYHDEELETFGHELVACALNVKRWTLASNETSTGIAECLMMANPRFTCSDHVISRMQEVRDALRTLLLF